MFPVDRFDRRSRRISLAERTKREEHTSPLDNRSCLLKSSLSLEERERLAKIFSAPQSLGEIISEDREERF